jgi:hypothetical protein
MTSASAQTLKMIYDQFHSEIVCPLMSTFLGIPSKSQASLLFNLLKALECLLSLDRTFAGLLVGEDLVSFEVEQAGGV